jgi:hypothetical protein
VIEVAPTVIKAIIAKLTNILLKTKGTFYFTSKNSEACFFRTYPIYKQILPKLLGGGK